MSDGAHDGHGSQIDIAGYRTCKNSWCGALIVEEVAIRTRSLCPECFRGTINETVVGLEIKGRGQRSTISSGAARRKTTKGNRGTKAAVEQAKRRARKRLCVLFPDMYQILLAEERARAGLEPWPIEMAAASGSDPDGHKTLAFAEVYHHLRQAGVDVDGPAISHPEDVSRER